MTKTIFNITPVPAPRANQWDYKIKTGRNKGQKKPFHLMRPCVKKYINYKNQLTLLASMEKYQLTQPLNMVFVLPMPRSWSKKKKEKTNGLPHQSKPDLDNLIKSFKDAVLAEDSFVHHYKDIKKVWGYFGRIEVYN